jgi:molybdopterin converting factor small subunit
VRYWAAARAVAGREEDAVDGATLADVLNAVRARHRDRPQFGDVLAVSSVLIGAAPLGSRDPADVVVRPGDVIEVLPPFAGG